MDSKELSKYVNLSLQTIYNLVHTNQIPYQRISKKRAVFDKNEIDEWLKTRKRKVRHAKLAKKETHEDPVPIPQYSSTLTNRDKSISKKQNEKLNREIIAAKDTRELKTAENKDSSSNKISLEQNTEILSPPGRRRSIFSVPASIVAPSSSRSFFVQWISVLLFIAIGWGGGFLYFHYKSAENASKYSAQPLSESRPASDSRLPFRGVIDLASLIEQGKPGRIDVLIPSTESEKTEVHMNRISDIQLRGEATSLLKPLLLQSLKSDSGDYAFKSRTIDIVRPYADDPKIQDAIIHLAKNDKDPSIRLKAVTVLDKVAGIEDVKEALLDRLINDENAGIRFKALEIIEKNMDLKVIPVLKKVKDNEMNESVRNKARAIFDNYERKNI